MRRTSFVVCAAIALAGFSIAFSQQPSPHTPSPLPPSTGSRYLAPPLPFSGSGQPANVPLPEPLPPPLTTVLVPPAVTPPHAPPAHGPVTSGPGERMTVKVYAVPDLIGTAPERPAAPAGLMGDPELASVMQQVQAQVQAAAVTAGLTQTPSDAERKLERLKKAIRVAAPKKSWSEGGGEGEIEVYPEAMSLIVRQTATGHEAIADLLVQLRATQDVQIELSIEVMSFDGASEEATVEVMKLLGKEMTADEVTTFKKAGKMAMTSVVRLANGRSGAAGLPELPLTFTCVSSPDRRLVEFRTDLNVPVDPDNKIAMQAFAQSRSVTAGKTVALLLGDAILLVTPQVIDRAPRATSN